MANLVSYVSVRGTGRLLAVLTLAAFLVGISLAPVAAPVAQAQTEAPTAIELDNNPAGDAQGALASRWPRLGLAPAICC